MSVHRLRRWPNIEAALTQSLVIFGIVSFTLDMADHNNGRGEWPVFMTRIISVENISSTRTNMSQIVADIGGKAYFMIW